MPYWIQVFDLTLPLIIHGTQRRCIVCLPLSSLICKESVSSRSSYGPVLCCPPPHMPGARHTRGWSGVISIPGSRDVNFIMLAPPNSSPRLCLCISSAPCALAATYLTIGNGLLPGTCPLILFLLHPFAHNSQNNLFKRHIYYVSPLLKFLQLFSFLVDKTQYIFNVTYNVV